MSPYTFFLVVLDNKIWMHDLLQQMKQDLVQQEFPESLENGADYAMLMM